MPGRLLGFDLSRATQSSPIQVKSIPPKRPASPRQLSSSPPRTNSMEHFKRPALNKKHSSDGRVPSHGSQPGGKHVSFELITESPPALLLDDPQASSGALYSVKLHMTVRDTPVVLTKFTLKLEAVSRTKKPVVEKCAQCSAQTTAVKEWKFITEKTTFQPGKHEFPASHLIPGHLPATTYGQISSIEYQFVAHAQSDKGAEFSSTKPLEIRRAIRPGVDKNSIRVFPPTNLALNVSLPSVVHPMGDFNVTARMTGMTTQQGETQTRWRLRKLEWRIEENEVAISPACSKHAAKVGGEGKGVMHESTKMIGNKHLKSGWKTDFEAGEIEGEFVCNIDAVRKPNADVASSNGMKITHTLVLEMIIAEEWAPIKKPKAATPTGVARVLRTQFNLVVTERAGMGIAWDDEMPPLYEDVPDSPPAYLQMEDYDGDELNDDVEHLHLGA